VELARPHNASMSIVNGRAWQTRRACDDVDADADAAVVDIQGSPQPHRLGWCLYKRPRLPTVLCWPWTLPLRSDSRLSCTLTPTPTRPPWRRRTTALPHTLRCACLSLQTVTLSQHEDDESASRATAPNAVNLTSPYALDPPPGLGRRRLRLGQFAGDAATTPLPTAHLGPVALGTLAALS